MDPSKIPTDNLYKFIALCGLVLAVASGYAMWTLNDKASFYEFEEQYYLNTMRAIGADWNKEKDPEHKAALGKVLSSTADTYLDRRHKSEVTREKFLNDAPNTRRMLYIGQTLGFMLMIAGFFLWYHKLQKHLDAAVAAGFKPGS